MRCIHPFKAIRNLNLDPHEIEWVCSTCHTVGYTNWEEAHHWERAEAMLKYYEVASPEMMPGRR